jgi:hypothetical protein
MPSDASWIQPGQTVMLHDRPYDGGMVYFGSRLAPVEPAAMTQDPALIDPGQPIYEGLGPEPSYYPAWHTLTPQQRARFVDWITTGRRDPDTYIGYVFLFFYGIERRVLHELAGSIDAPEVDLLLAEVRALRATYAASRSFVSYATRFLDFVAAMQGQADPELPPALRRGELPWALRLKLARLAKTGKPLGAIWAWAWLTLSPLAEARTVVRRCPDECEALFGIRYRQRFEGGYMLDEAPVELVASYRPASASFGLLVQSGMRVRLRGLTDVASRQESIALLVDLYNEVTEELDPFSRWLGRHLEGRLMADVVTLLPEELIDASVHPGLRRVAHATRQLLGKNAVRVLSFGDMVSAMGGALEMPAGPAGFSRLTEVLHRVGCGVEPDPEFGVGPPAASDLCVLFRRPMAAHHVGVSARFTVAALSLRLSVLVLQSDGALGEDEITLLDRQIDAMLRLTGADRARLRARVRLYQQVPASERGLTRILASAPPGQAHLLGQMLARLASQGSTSSARIATLERLFEQMGLDRSALHDQLHDHALGTDTPPPAPAAPTLAAEPTADAPAPEPPPLLDEARIAARIAESDELSDLLGDIFAEQDEPAPAPAAPSSSGPLAHLLAALRERAIWPLGEFTALARTHGLPVDGALEQLDDLSWQHAGESLFDSYDPILVNEDALTQIP